MQAPLSAVFGLAKQRQPVTIHAPNPHIAGQARNSQTAICWIEYDANGLFTSSPWCQRHLPVGTYEHPSQNRRQRTSQPQLVVGGTAIIQDRIVGQPGTAVCFLEFDSRNIFVTIPWCERGRGGTG